jgi:sugar phosphate isomerase/epimerase
MKLKTCIIALLFCALAWADDPKLRGGNILSCETYSYRELILAGKLDPLTVPAFYKEQGIKGISLNERYLKSRDNAYVDQVKEAVKKAGRLVTCLVIDGNLAMASEAKRKEQTERDKESLRIAHRLGAPLVRINVGATDRNENADDTLGVERVSAAFKELLPLARELKIKISIENHGGVSKSAANIVKIIQATDPKWVGALVDFGNFPPEIRYDEIARLAPYAFGTHVKVNEFDPQGEAASYDFPRVLGIVKKHAFKGPISIEYEGKGDPLEGVRKSRALILKYW